MSVCLFCGSWAFTGNLDVSLEKIYGEEYFQGAEYKNYLASQKIRLLNFRRKYSILKSFLTITEKQIRCLEIGSATGDFLEFIKETGGSAIGVEVSKFAANLSKSRGHRVFDPHDPLLLDEIAAFRPNLIVAWDVWEHLERPAETFKAVLSRASPETWLALTTVDAGSVNARLRGKRWRLFHPPTHLNYPTTKAIETYLASLGLCVCHHQHFGYYRPLGEYCGSSSSHAILQVPVYLNLFDIQYCIAKTRHGKRDDFHGDRDGSL